MKRSSSNCFRVSILRFPHLRWSGKGLTETNHEQTLSVRYVFRNHLIWREQPEIGISPLAGAGIEARNGQDSSHGATTMQSSTEDREASACRGDSRALHLAELPRGKGRRLRCDRT